MSKLDLTSGTITGNLINANTIQADKIYIAKCIKVRVEGYMEGVWLRENQIFFDIPLGLALKLREQQGRESAVEYLKSTKLYKEFIAQNILENTGYDAKTDVDLSLVMSIPFLTREKLEEAIKWLKENQED